MGYDDSQLREQRHPTRDDLDAVSKDTPVLVVHQSGHLAVLNSKGLEAVGYSAETVEPPGGTIRRRAGSREPDGLIGGMAWWPQLFSKLGRLGSEDNKALLLAGLDRYAEFGFTTAQEGRATAEAVATEAALAEQGKLKIDVVAYPDIQGAASAISGPFLSKSYTGRFRIGGAKLTLDGSPQGKTAWLTEPYRVPPAGRGKDYAGSPAMTDERGEYLRRRGVQERLADPRPLQRRCGGRPVHPGRAPRHRQVRSRRSAAGDDPRADGSRGPARRDEGARDHPLVLRHAHLLLG